ncbi:MAG TPA: carboxypeptidase regulatory-like domain-containing protein [Spirochaetota bacterium]|nr:carboxypeptidase regulatory-like domain-containing protein [Spirochaetota bacterium]
MLKKIVLNGALIAIGVFFLSCDTAEVKRLSDGRSLYGGDSKKLSGKSAIEGYVIDTVTKKGIKNAKVEIKNANMGVGYYLRETEWNGYFKIDDFIPYIKYMVEVSAEGYVTYTSTGAVSEGSHKIELRPESVLTGTVCNSRGEPLRGIEVKLNTYNEESGEEGEYASPKPRMSATDQNGLYRFDKLPAGSYLATFSGPGFITETAQLQKIKEGETFTLPMVMIRPATVTGVVTIEGIETPAINVDVTLSGNVTYSATTYQDGTFRLEDVKPGNYKMKVSHQGFYDLQGREIRIHEGEKRDRVNFTVRAKEPQVQVYAHRYTFSPGDTVEFNLRSLRLESLRVTIYRVPVDLLVRGGVDPDTINPEESGLKAVTSWDEPIREFEPYEWRYQSLQVKTAMPTGGYCVEVKGAGKVISRKFFSLTTVGVVMKRSQDSIFAYVTNLVDNTPIPDARIAVFDATPVQKKGKKRATYKAPEKVEDLPVALVLKGTTDVEGIYHRKIQSSKYLSTIVIAKDGSYALCNTGAPSSFEKEQKKYFIYTDRPVYRAGDTVHYKIIGKNRERRFVPVAGQKIYYKIRNWDMDRTIDEGEASLDDWGVADSKVVLSREGNLGIHEIMVGPSENNLYSRGKFYVEQYRKPEFVINVTPAKEYFINGDTAEFKVEAKYFFGAPLKGALVKYRFYETKLRDDDTSYWWEQDYGTGGSYNRIILEGEKYADNDGIAVLRLHAGNYPYDREITCEATVVDRSNVSISSTNKVKVGRGEYYIKIEPAQHFFSSGEKKPVTIRTMTHTGRPYRAKVKVDLYRYIWKPWERVYVHDSKPLFSEQVATDDRGAATVELPKQFSFYGEFDLVVNGVDRKDNVVSASRVIWIYSMEGARVASRFKNLELSVNSTELTKPGEITCLIKSCFTDAYVCVTLEGRDVYESKVIKMTGNIMPVKFDIKPEYAPNLYVTATMQRKRALYTSSVGVSLPIHDTALTISIETDKAKYLPGEKANVLLRAVDGNGKPVKADLSLAAVDEAIFQVRYDHTPLMRDYFYTKISNWVLTSYSYPITMLAGAAKDGKVKVREKFEDTAFWSAKIRTGDDGTARVNFTLPDNLTTWRLTARGHDREGRMGEKKSTFLVTQDLIARIGKPRFMVEGDTLDLIGIVNSNTERGLKKVDTIFKADDKVLAAEEEVSISLPPFGSARNYYPYKVPKDKREVALQFSALSILDARDALKVAVPVERRGTPFKLYGIGDMAANRTVTVTPLAETDDFNFVAESVTVSVSPSPIIQMLRATKYLSEYPYGCIEQALNSFIPNLALNRMLKQKGYDRFINDKAKKKLDDKVSAGVDRIQRYQNDDGTWGWWSGSRGNAFVTGYVLFSLHLAQEAGFAVDKSVVTKGLGAIKKYFANPQLEEWDAIAYLIYINALWGRWDHEIFKKILKVNEPGTYQTACLVKALSLAKSHPTLTDEMKSDINGTLPKLVESIIQTVKKDGRGIYWESRGRDRWSWPGGETEMTAHVLSALVSAGDRSTLPAQLVRSLCGRSRGDSWNSTKETATVMLALCGYLEQYGGSAVTRGNVMFSLDGKKIADVDYDLENPGIMEKLTRKIELAGERPRASFTVSADGNAGADVNFDVTIAGTLYFKEKGALSLVRSEERGIGALSNGIRITRTFASIMRVRDSRNNEYMVPQSLAEKKVIQVGDELLVKVKFQAQDDFQYLVLEDYLPSGFEVTRNNAYDEYTPFVHIERWDNRMVYFFTDLKKNEVYEVAYIVRAELPGNFMVKPSRMECMYEPTIQGWSAPVVVDVKKK